MFSETHVPANWIGLVFDCRPKSCDTRRLKKKKVKRSGCCCGNALDCFHHTSHKQSAKQLILPKPSYGAPTTPRGGGIVVFAATVHQAEIPMLWFRRDLMWLFFIHRCVHTSSHHASILACTPQSTALHLSTSIYLCFWWFVGLACTNFLCQTPSPYDLRWNSNIVLFVWCFFFVLWENVGVF